MTPEDRAFQLRYWLDHKGEDLSSTSGIEEDLRRDPTSLLNDPADLPEPAYTPYPLMRYSRAQAPLWSLAWYAIRLLWWRAKSAWRKI